MNRKTVTIGDSNLELLSALGQGTYGSVYLIHTNNGMKAVKIITNVKDEGIKSLREIDIMSRLVHPNLVRAEGIIVGVDTIVTLGIIMPLAKTDLQRLMRLPIFTTTQRLKILFDAANGVKYLHDTGHLHLDLKPMNILIFGEGDNLMGKLTDFGLSLILQNNSKYYPLELVTITHRAPELMKGERNYTKAVDIWSLGIIFLEVLSGGKQIFSDFTKSKIRAETRKFLNPVSITPFLNRYLSGLPGSIKTSAVELISRMLNINPSLRPSIDEVINSDLFQNHLPKKDIGHGMAIYKRPYPPRKCDPIYYYGFDFMVRTAMKLSIQLETFFLAADIYQRSLAYSRELTGNFQVDWPNVALLAMTSLYMAIKMLEPYHGDIKKLSEYANNVFNPEDIIRVEAFLTQLFEGLIYQRSLFTDSEGKNRLIYAFDKLLRNCHAYHRINLDLWVEDGRMKPEMPYNKYILFSNFIPETEYHKKIFTESRRQYIPEMYQEDLDKVRSTIKK
jgi:hypothetical protein